MICSIKVNELVERIAESAPFDFLEGWRLMWSKNIELDEIKVFTLEDRVNELLQRGWERNNLFPEGLLQFQGDTQLMCSRRKDTMAKKIYFEFHDMARVNTLEYPDRLVKAHILERSL